MRASLVEQSGLTLRYPYEVRDEQAANVLPVIREIQAAGYDSCDAIAGQLNARKIARKETATAEHLKFVLSVIDGPRFAKGNSSGRSPA
jgi:hypothetical protein